MILHADLIVEASNLVLCREVDANIDAEDAVLIEARVAAKIYLVKAFEHAGSDSDD